MIDRLERLPPPHDAHYGVVPLPPPTDGIVLGDVAYRHHRAIDALATVATLAREIGDPYVVSRLLPRREAVSSSAIEGTNSTLDELLAVEEDAEEAVQDAVRQVRDYALTLEALIPRAQAEGPAFFTEDTICALHRTVMRGDASYRYQPGALREIVVWIGGRDIAYSSYNPPPPARVRTGLADSLDYMRGGLQQMTQSLIARLAIAHVHFEAVHPFPDGNGRVGRLLLPLIMAADGAVPLYLSPYIEAHKSAYYASLKAAQQQLDWSSAIGFMADAVSGTVDELIATRAALTDLRVHWRARRRFRQGSAAMRALDLLINYPVITLRSLGQRLDISPPAALTAINQLVDAQILEERTGMRRNRIFAATEVLSLLNRPFGVAPITPEAPSA